MRLYKNIGEDVDILSDAYKFEKPEGFEGVVTEVQSRMVVKGDVNVDVGCGNAFGGKNEDEEEEGGAGNAPPEKVNDLVDAFQYGETGMSKDDFKSWMKEYAKVIIAKIPAADQDRFKKGFQAFAKRILSKFDDFTIYCPSSWTQEGALIFSYWKNETDEAPVFWYLLDGLPSEKY